MHKKLESELVSLAHSILKMKNRDDVVALKDKAQLVYEKLAVLVYVEEYTQTTPNLKLSKDDLLKKIDLTLNTSEKKITKPIEPKKVSETKTYQPPNETKQVTKQPTSKENVEFFKPKFDSVRIDINSLKENQISSKEEFRDAVSADKTAYLFDAKEESTKKQTLSTKTSTRKIAVGLNDRIAFVNNLFNFDQAAFNKILDHLNNCNTEQEAKKYIENVVKPERNWQGKEPYEERFLALIERKFS